MKWYNSLITKITLIFILAFIGAGAVIYIIHTQIQEFEINNTKMYTKAILNSSYDKKTNTININNLVKAGYIQIKDEKLKHEILKNRKFVPKRVMSSRHFRVKTISNRGNIYIILQKDLVFKAPHQKRALPQVLMPISAVMLILFLYIATIRSILPLYDLRQKVKKFADGDYEVDCHSDKKDEIGILSNEFDNGIKKIKKLRDSRQLFLRNIMHELKTPITKGKLSCEMIEDSTYQEILKNVFRRQETLLNEFARIEKLSANELDINTKKYALQDIVDFSLDIINHKPSNVTCRLTPMSLHVDFELFATSLKNLIDNGINYSDDKHVIVESNATQIIISNSGKELEFPLERYAEPYFLDAKKAKSSRGLGFGLFITLNVIRLHNMKIEYNRKNDRNVFTINVKTS